MRFLLEIDGPLADIAGAYDRAYRETAAAVGWSALDQATCWRLIRTKGREAAILPGASALKVKDFWNRFAARIETDEVLLEIRSQAWADASLRALRGFGSVALVTLGTNVSSRRTKLAALRLIQATDQIEAVETNPGRRAGQLRALAAGDRRCIVVAATDSLLRAAGEAELFGVGVSSGSCAGPRLHAAGADVVYKDLTGLIESLQSGAADLVRAGLLPSPLG